MNHILLNYEALSNLNHRKIWNYNNLIFDFTLVLSIQISKSGLLYITYTINVFFMEFENYSLLYINYFKVVMRDIVTVIFS